MDIGFKFSDGKPYSVIAFVAASFIAENCDRAIEALMEECDRERIRIVYFTSCSNLMINDRNDLGEQAGFDWIEPERYDAIVMMSETFKDQTCCDALIQRANAAGVPIISVDRYKEGCINIDFSYGDSFEQVVRHLVLDHGFTRLNMIAGMRNNSFSDDRIAAYRKVLEENGIEYDERRVGYGDFWEVPAMQVVDDFMNSDLPFPQAIICANDAMAMAACEQLRKYDYRVPDDIVVTGFDGIEIERYHTPRLTTCDMNLPQLVKTVCDIVHKIRGGQKEHEDVTIDYRFRIGASCGCMPNVMLGSGERLFELAIRAKENEYATRNGYVMLSSLSNKPSLNEVFHSLSQYAFNFIHDDFWICTNEDMMDPNYSFIREMELFHNPETTTVRPMMHVPICCVSGQMYEKKSVNAPFLIPNFEETLEKLKCLMVLPIHAEELPLGYMVTGYSHNTKLQPFYSFATNIMHTLANFRIAAERENHLNKDQLTKLYNRRGYYGRVKAVLADCVRDAIPFAVISIDMDGLKPINDNYGHKEGDYALKTFSSYMLSCIREDEFAARFGGDEFVISFGGENAKERADEIVHYIEKRIEKFNANGTKPYRMGASIGVSITVPNAKTHLDDVIREADDAMYTTKAKHKREMSREDG